MMGNNYFKRHILSLIVLAFLSFVFLGCSTDSEDEPQFYPTPKVFCTLTVNDNTFYVGQELAATIKVDFDELSNNAEVKYVEFYFDNMFIQKVTSSPFVLDYKLENVSEGTHTLSAMIVVGGTNYANITINKDVTITVKEIQEPEVKLYGLFPYAGANGKIYHGWVYKDVNMSSPNCEIKKVDYYWDDHLVATATSEEGYALDLKLDDTNGVEGSQHMLKAIAIVGGENYKDMEITMEETVRIVSANECLMHAALFPNPRNTIFKNGTYVMVDFWQCYGGETNSGTIKAKIFWDGNLVSSGELAVQGNKVIHYQIKNAYVGEHKLAFESITLDNGELVGSQKTEFTVTVIE